MVAASRSCPGAPATMACMSERMPDFRMPSDDELAAERARAVVPAAPSSSRRTSVTIAAVAAGALVVGGLAIGVPMLASPSPQAIVDEYVAAVASGDAAAAAALWMPAGTDVDLALLALAAPARPATIECDAVVVDGDAATATCDVEIDVEPTPFGGAVVLDLARDGQRWRLASGLEQPTQLFSGVGAVATVADVEVPDGSGVTNAPFLLPGVYAAEVVVSPFLVPVAEPVVVVGTRGGVLQAEHELAQSVVDDAASAAIEATDPSASDLEATLVGVERRTWQTFVREFEVAPPGGAPVARVAVEISLSADGAGVAIEAGPVVSP